MLKNFKNVLSLSEMRVIKGGVEPEPNTCGYKTSGGTIACGVSKSVAQSAVSGGGNWCCDSCPSTTYCGSSGGGGNPPICNGCHLQP